MAKLSANQIAVRIRRLYECRVSVEAKQKMCIRDRFTTKRVVTFVSLVMSIHKHKRTNHPIELVPIVCRPTLDAQDVTLRSLYD